MLDCDNCRQLGNAALYGIVVVVSGGERCLNGTTQFGDCKQNLEARTVLPLTASFLSKLGTKHLFSISYCFEK